MMMMMTARKTSWILRSRRTGNGLASSSTKLTAAFVMEKAPTTRMMRGGSFDRKGRRRWRQRHSAPETFPKTSMTAVEILVPVRPLPDLVFAGAARTPPLATLTWLTILSSWDFVPFLMARPTSHWRGIRNYRAADPEHDTKTAEDGNDVNAESKIRTQRQPHQHQRRRRRRRQQRGNDNGEVCSRCPFPFSPVDNFTPCRFLHWVVNTVA